METTKGWWAVVTLGSFGLIGAEEAPKASSLQPVISEVLFNVPPGETGDANKDGARDSTGDEFIELFNPHGKAIDLKGYTITSRLSTGDKDPKRGVRFVFPKFELPPGGVVVVFNGYKSTIPGAVGSSERAPGGVNKEFGEGYVFSMQIKQPMLALKNDGDYVLLADAAGKPVACVTWGKSDPAPPASAGEVDQVAGSNRCSLQRVTAKDTLANHTAIDGRAFSPGEMPSTADKPVDPPQSADPPDAPDAPKTSPVPGRQGPKKPQ